MVGTILELIKTAVSLRGQQRDANAQLKELSEGLAAITSLNLSCNVIDDAGMETLAEVLQTNTTLTSLNLFNNNIGAARMQALAEALKTNKTLTSLNLARNNISDAGIIALAEALKTNKTLTSLNLCINNIGEAGIVALAEALKTNKTLTSLQLSINNLGDAGVEVLAEALKTNTALTFLSLYDNYLSATGMKAKSEIDLKIKENKQLAERLIKAAQTNDLATVKLWVNEGASVNYQDEGGNTALHYAAKHTNHAMIDFLYGLSQQSIHLKNKQGEVVDPRLFKRGYYDFGGRYVRFFGRPISVEQIPKKHHEAYKPDVMTCTIR